MKMDIPHLVNVTTDGFAVYSPSLDTDYTMEVEGDSGVSKISTISHICRQAARYYVATVIVFGVLGNLGCLICYRRSEELKRYRSTGYLMALAISDLTFLLCLSLIWLKSIGIEWHDAQFVCQTSVYASNASIFLSAWYVLALTSEMAFALRRPYRAYMAAIDAGTTVLLRIFIVTIIGLGVNSWTLALTKTGTMYLPDAEPEPESEGWDDLQYVEPTGPEAETMQEYDGSYLDSLLLDNMTNLGPLTYDTGCHISSNNQMLHRTFVLLDIVFTYCVPLVMTLFLNVYIGYKLIQAGHRRRHMSQRGLFDNRQSTIGYHTSRQNSLTQLCDRNSLKMKRRYGQQLDHCPFTPNELSRLHSGPMRKMSTNRAPSNRKKETAVSSLLIAKSMAYLIFNSPSCVHRIWSMLKREAATGSGDPSEAEPPQQLGGDGIQNWVYTIIYMLFFTQFSINFILYSWHAYTRRKCRVRAAKAILRPYHSPARFL